MLKLRQPAIWFFSPVFAEPFGYGKQQNCRNCEPDILGVSEGQQMQAYTRAFRHP